MNDKPIMIVPLLSERHVGKIIQGMAAGKVIISTTIGAEGIELHAVKNILIADTPEEIARGRKLLSGLIRKSSLPFHMEAQKLVAEKYTGKAIGEKLDAFYKKLLPDQLSIRMV